MALVAHSQMAHQVFSLSQGDAVFGSMSPPLSLQVSRAFQNVHVVAVVSALCQTHTFFENNQGPELQASQCISFDEEHASLLI